MTTNADPDQVRALFSQTHTILVDPDSSIGPRRSGDIVAWPIQQQSIWATFYDVLNFTGIAHAKEVQGAVFSYESLELWQMLAARMKKTIHVGALKGGQFVTKTVYQPSGYIHDTARQ